jgi:hypothetical protein
MKFDPVTFKTPTRGTNIYVSLSGDKPQYQLRPAEPWQNNKYLHRYAVYKAFFIQDVDNPMQPPSDTTINATPEDFYIPEEYSDKPLSDDFVSDLANQLLDMIRTQYPDYLTFVSVDASDVSAAKAEMGYQPVLGDIVSDPMTFEVASDATPGTGTNSDPDAGAGGSPDVTTDAPSDVNVNVDVNVDVQFPELTPPDRTTPDIDTTLTLPSIIDDALSSMSEYTNANIAFRDVACPTIDLPAVFFSESQSITSHCDLFESNRTMIQTIMLLLYTMIALSILLRA